MAKTKRPAVKGLVFTAVEVVTVLESNSQFVPLNDRRSRRGKKPVAIPRGTGVVKPKQAAKWNGKFDAVKEWLRHMGRYPKSTSSNKIEAALGTWLRHNLPGGNSFRPERWAMLNNAFGWGWEFEFSPGFGQR